MALAEDRKSAERENAGKKTFYITTPIYYPSDNLHIGHAYTTVAADAIARFKRQQGYDTFFLTGTDEHGQKIAKKAKAAGKEPQEFVDEIVARIKVLWQNLGISYDDFIRTTEERHIKVVQDIFQKVYEKGDIYKSQYEGWYCIDCEAFYTETQVKEYGGICPDHGKPFERLQEESYFFRLSRYADRLLRHIEENPDFIQPASRRAEMISFIKSGLEDLSVSRTTFKWGIPVPWDPKHVIYVWFDALTNYVTAAGYGTDPEKFHRYWPADVHLVGKEIVRFHTIIWPIILMAADIELPKQVFGHGWLVLESGKMSKAKGNVVDPNRLIEKYGLDAVRYFLLREIPFGADGYYSEEALINRINADLANDLGNLLNRTLTMIERYFHGTIPAPGAEEALDRELRELWVQAVTEATGAMERLELSNALVSLFKWVARANKYIDEVAPWVLAREGKEERLRTALYYLAEGLRQVAVALAPFLIETPEKIWRQLGLSDSPRSVPWEELTRWGGLPAGTRIEKGEPLFPRIDPETRAPAATKKGLPAQQERRADMANTQGEVAEGETKAEAGPKEAANSAMKSVTDASGNIASPKSGGDTEVAGTAVTAQEKGDGTLIDIETFRQIDLRVARVLAAEKVKGADKLLKLKLDLGGEEREIVSGIAQYYQPEALVGKNIVVVANLKPAKIRGIESRGMLLAASNEAGLVLVTTDGEIAPGSRVK